MILEMFSLKKIFFVTPGFGYVFKMRIRIQDPKLMRILIWIHIAGRFCWGNKLTLEEVGLSGSNWELKTLKFIFEYRNRHRTGAVLTLKNYVPVRSELLYR